MKFELRRVTLFTGNMAAMSAFYADALGLELVGSEDGWRDYRAGSCHIALHQGRAEIGRRPPKLVFYASDVAAARALLIARGVTSIGKVLSTATFDMCDGKDPDGNAFQISSRR